MITINFEAGFHKSGCAMNVNMPMGRIDRHIRDTIRRAMKDHPIYQKYLDVDRFYLKLDVFSEDTLDLMDNEIDNYIRIGEQYDIYHTPRLEEYVKEQFTVHYSNSYEDYEEDLIYYGMILVLENCGLSIGQTYGTNYRGPGVVSTSLFEDVSNFDDEFPPEKIPESIRQQILAILGKFHNTGYICEDVHGGNFVVKDDVVTMVDLQGLTRNC